MDDFNVKIVDAVEGRARSARRRRAGDSARADFPRQVLELTPDDLARQLNDAATTFLEAPSAFHIDEAKHVVTVTLSAPCEFLLDPAAGGDDATARDVLKTSLRFVGKRRWRQLSLL